MLEFGTDNEEITENSPSAPFVLSIDDNGSNQLRIVIALPQKGSEGQRLDDFPIKDNDKLNEILLHAYPVYEDMSRVYEILFSDYIIYQCRNESYTCWDDREIRKGKYLIVFEKSRLLEYYEDVIFDFDSDNIKRERKHYGIYTENHVIDVISNQAPVITKLL